MTDPTDDEIAALRSEFGITSNGRGIKEFTQVRDFARAVLAKWGTPAPVGVEPVFAFRRKGLDDFCTCTEKRYAELSLKPNLFETRIFYTEPPVLAMGRVPLEEWHVRGQLAASLTFLHRLTGNEAAELVAFVTGVAAHGIKQGGQHGAE